MNAIIQTVAGNPENQDRGLIQHDGPRIILCVADGAGGRSGGAEAASMAVKLIRENAFLLGNDNSCVEALRKMDEAIAKDSIAGETTCALAIVTPEEIFGASVGDSGVWWIPESGNHLNLTWRCVASSISPSDSTRQPSARYRRVAQIHIGRTYHRDMSRTSR